MAIGLHFEVCGLDIIRIKNNEVCKRGVFFRVDTTRPFTPQSVGSRSSRSIFFDIFFPTLFLQQVPFSYLHHAIKDHLLTHFPPNPQCSGVFFRDFVFSLDMCCGHLTDRDTDMRRTIAAFLALSPAPVRLPAHLLPAATVWVGTQVCHCFSNSNNPNSCRSGSALPRTHV